MLHGGFASREDAEDHPVRLASWKRIWIDTVERPISRLPSIPPLPWSYESSAAQSNNGSFHLYLVDADGRKIAAIWGKGDEKRLTAEHILKVVNAP